jgi:hypothetical protein
VIHGQENKVCKLDNSLYGLNQAHMEQHEKYDIVMITNEYKVNESDKSINYKYENDICMIICLYVDDFLIFGSKNHVVNYVKLLFINNIDKKGLCKVELILGIKITRI